MINETSNHKNINYEKPVKNKVENDIECLFEHPLSDDQILLSKSIFENTFKSIKTPKLVQIISQPQAGKTNTILNILALIGNYSHNNPKFDARGFLTVFFQPSDNVLKEQLEDRLTYEYQDKINKKEETVSCLTLEANSLNEVIENLRSELENKINIGIASDRHYQNEIIRLENLNSSHSKRIVRIQTELHDQLRKANDSIIILNKEKHELIASNNIMRDKYESLNQSIINFENEQQWIIIVIGQQNELGKSSALKNQFFTLNGSFLG